MDTVVSWGQLIPLFAQLPRNVSGEPDWDAAEPQLLQAIGQVAAHSLRCLPLQLDGLAQLMVCVERSDAAALPTATLTGLGLVFWLLADVMHTSQALLAEIAPRLADFSDPGAAS